MPKRGTKRKAGPEPPSDGLDPLFAGDNSAKGNKTKRSKRLSQLDEYEEDEGRQGSRNFQKWGELFEGNIKNEAAKSKDFMRKFTAKVKQQADQVRDYMQEQEKQLGESNVTIVSAFEKLYSTAAVPGVSTNQDSNGRDIEKESHVLFTEAQDIISRSYALLKTFEETDERLKDYKLGLPTAKWKQDKEDMRELLACGREYGERLVEEKLAPGAYLSRQQDRPKANEKDIMISELFKDSRKPEEDNWGTVAADQLKKFTAIAKTVPPKALERK